MKRLRYLWFLLFLFSSITVAETPPLRVGFASFVPPFVLQGGHNQLYGFDVIMVQTLCKMMKRQCQFKPMRFKYLFRALNAGEIDLAVGAIAITPSRVQKMSFSQPYLPSFLAFLTQTNTFNEPFNILQLANKRIGVVEGTIFAEEIQRMGIKNPKIISFRTEAILVNALASGKIDAALMDAADCEYWANRSAGILSILGKKMPYGFGLGIVVKLGNLSLLKAINNSLSTYIGSDDYKKNYTAYFGT